MKISRKLTQGEVALAKSVFGESLNYDDITIKNHPMHMFQPANFTMAPNGHIYCNQTYKGDFSMASIGMQAHFIHEMTHVWQYQNKVKHPVMSAAKDMIKHKFNYSAAYAYEPDPKKDLTAYNLEQQACIIQDHFLILNGCHPQKIINYSATKTGYVKAQQDLTNILGNFLKNPKYASRKSWFARTKIPKWDPNRRNRK